MINNEDTPIKSVLGIILNTLRENKLKAISMLLISLVTVLLSLVPPQILKLIIDDYLAKKISSGLFRLATYYMLVLIFIGIFDFLKEWFITILGQKMMHNIRFSMMDKLAKVDLNYLSDEDSGSIVSRFINDVNSINSMFSGGIIGMFVDSLKIIGITISIWIFSQTLGIITLLIIPILFFITRFFQKRMMKAQKGNRKTIGNVNNHISESLKNIQMIKIGHKESFMENRYREHLIDNYETIDKINFYDSVFSPIIQMIRAIVIGIIVILASNQLGNIAISIGMVAASIELISNLFSPIENLGMEIQKIQAAFAGIDRVNEFLNLPEIKLQSNEIELSTLFKTDDRAEIKFNHVAFKYRESHSILDDVSLIVPREERLTLIGRTGAGKSTIFKLILGLISPTSGNITINGIDVCDIPNDIKRQVFGYVDQSFYVVSGTLLDQITLKDPNITVEQVFAALKLVGLDDFVNELADGVETRVTESLSLSQGQKQLFAIARAIVLNPPILLMDEITSNLDSVTEAQVLDAIKRAGESHTILSISHRLSTLVFTDNVALIEDGKVIPLEISEKNLKWDL